MTDKEISKALDECLNYMQIDYLPLHDIFRAFFGFNKLEPTNSEFQIVLDTINTLMTKMNVVCLESPEMTVPNKPLPELLTYLKTIYDNGEYDKINYGIWFDIQPKNN